MRFYTWLITISTKDDIDRVVAQSITGYLKKKCRYGIVVLESAAKLHLHAAVCFNSAMEKKHFEETIWLKIEKAHPTSIKRIALKSTVQYNHDWYTTYLQKDTSRVVLWDNYVAEEYEKFFPTDQEQAELKAASEAKKPLAGDAKDPRFTALETKWCEYSDDVSYQGAVKFLKYSMNVERSIQVISDPRRLCQTAWALYEFRGHIVEPCVDQINFGQRMSGLLPEGSFTVPHGGNH